jgi:dephospho-CoA kinase
MLIVGLTGGIASGKSVVMRIFREQGAHVIDADRIVHNLLAPGQKASQEIAAYFGKDFLLPDGSVDRRKLGEIVFRDAEKRAWLNACIHPRVFEAYNAQVMHLRERDPAAIVILDAALLVETGYHKKMDRLIVVYAEEEQQVTRLMERDLFTREQALSRIRSQMPLAEKRNFADYVIDNTGTREQTEQQARVIFTKLAREARNAS